MKKLLSLLAIAACCSLGQASYAQNVEGQIVASQFGNYQVPGIATGSLAFEPSTCQVSGGGKNFVAFTTGVPVKIVDANPALTEVDTPSSVNITGCSISMATTYIHTTPFYATSGTGGLQEALTNGPNKQGGPNTVILNADWYTQVAPSNPATVIAAVKGSTKLGLVDVTTIPYTVYAWNGSAYAVVPYSGGGANFPSTPGIVWNLTTSTARNATSNDLVAVFAASSAVNINANAANLFGTPALPNGVTATTGTVGENDNKLATNAAIYASKIASIPVTTLVLKGNGVAGQSVPAIPGTDYLLPGGTTTSKIINGVGYSALYSGSTVDARVNSCLSDAMSLANGNTTGICNATGETGTLNTVAQINVGNSSGAPVTLIVPSQGQWRGSMTDGTSCTVNQFGNTSILGAGPESGIGSQFVFGATASSSLACVFKLTPLGSQLNYIHDSNFSIVNVNGGPYTGHVTTGGIGANFFGPMYDSSTVDHVVVFDALDATAAQVSGFCCGAVFRNMSINGNYGSGVTPLVITNTSAFDMETLSVVHPGATKPIIQFTDSSSHTSNANIHGLYMEGSTTDTTTAWIQNSGYGSINLSDVTAKAEASGVSTAFMTSTNTTNTGITIRGFNAVNGGGDWFYPVTAIINSFTGQTVQTDNTSAKGNLAYYASNGSSVGSLSTYGGGLTVGPTAPSAGSPSGAFKWQAPYNNGTSTVLDTYSVQMQIGSGVNPFSQVVWDHPSGTPGGGQHLFLPHVTFAGGVGISTGTTLQIADLAINSPVCTDSFSNLITGCGGGGSGSMTPSQFGAYGDGHVIGNGCTTNGTTTIVCSSGPFVSGDAGSGKYLCVAGAGTAGIGFCSTIATFTSSTTVTVTLTPPTSVTSAQSSFGHDDVVALQNCYNATSGGVPCVMNTPIGYNTPSGYLIVSAGLTIPTKANIQGAASNQGTTIISEFNGDAFSLPTSTASLQAGQPIEAATLSNFTVFHDPSWPNGRSFHINAAVGVFGFGGMFNSTISDVNSENAALECLWLDGHTNSDDNPNQYITFNQFKCNTADQMHTAAAVKITGIQAQIIFMGGSIDGPTLHSNAPNPLVYLGEKTSGQGDSPVDVKFFGFTCERTTACYSVNNGTNNIHVDNSYIEAVDSPLIASNTFGLTFSGNHIANSGNVGAVAQFSGLVSATLHDNFVYGSTPPAAFAACTGGTNNFNIDFQNNNSTLGTSSHCATNHEGTGAALFQAFGTTATVDASSTVITTIRDPNVSPGKTLTLKALSGGVGSFSLGTGGTPSGNDYPIDLGAFASPVTITAGNSVTLALLDASGAPVYTVVSGTDLPAAILASSETVASSANPIWSPAFATTYMVLGGNVTGPTLAAGADGQHKTLCFKQGAGPFTVASPANFKGFFTVGTVNGGLNCQGIVYIAPISFWVADGPGKTDQ